MPHSLCVAAPAGWRWRSSSSSSSRPAAAVTSGRHDGHTAGRGSHITHGSSTDAMVSLQGISRVGAAHLSMYSTTRAAASSCTSWMSTGLGQDACRDHVHSLPEHRERLPCMHQAHAAVLCAYNCLLSAATHSVDASDAAAAAPQVGAPQHVPAQPQQQRSAGC
jgi:hypothetical protein